MQKDKLSMAFGNFCNGVARFTGSPMAFILAALCILVWALSGPVFHFSDTWQLVINTGTTVITFLMVFIIQQSQNRETTALQIKLNELIAANKNASNRVVGIENLSQTELQNMKDFYDRMAEFVKSQQDLFSIQSVDRPHPVVAQQMETGKEASEKNKESIKK